MKGKLITYSKLICQSAVILSVFTTLSHAAVLYGVSVGGNRDYPGGDYARFSTSSLEDCVKNCADDGRCVAFSYQSSTGTCWLKDRIFDSVRAPGFKSGKKLTQNAPPSPDYSNQPPPQHYSTHPPQPRSMGMEYMNEVDLPGGDYQRIKAGNPQECAQVCMEDRQCFAFTYVLEPSDCFLKSFRPRPIDAGGVVSGVKR